MVEKQLENGDWEITWKQIGFHGTYKDLSEGRAAVMEKFRGGK